MAARAIAGGAGPMRPGAGESGWRRPAVLALGLALLGACAARPVPGALTSGSARVAQPRQLPARLERAAREAQLDAIAARPQDPRERPPPAPRRAGTER